VGEPEQHKVPENWVGQDVLVLLDPDAVSDLIPEARPDLELTQTLVGVSPHGALLRQGFRDPMTGTQGVGNVFYPWSSIRRIRQIEV
jgi:hypothetical protein